MSAQIIAAPSAPAHGQTRDVVLQVVRDRPTYVVIPGGVEVVNVGQVQRLEITERYCAHCGHWLPAHSAAALLVFVADHDSRACTAPIILA